MKATLLQLPCSTYRLIYILWRFSKFNEAGLVRDSESWQIILRGRLYVCVLNFIQVRERFLKFVGDFRR